MGTKVAKEAAPTYGCYVADDKNKMLHYAEHPESFISDTINAGIAIFNSSVFFRPVPRTPSKTNLFDFYSLFEKPQDQEVVSLERDVLPDLVSRGQVYVWEYTGFWRSVKNAGGAVYANAQYIAFYASKKPQLLTSSGTKEAYEQIGGVIVDPSATIHPTARIGPNVYIGAGTVVGKGARIANSIVQANVHIREHACLLYSIVSNGCEVGQWTRLEGIPEAVAATIGGHDSRYARMGITIFGDGVTANPEIIVRNCVVMSHKSLSSSVFNEIIL
jgi:mannose-1-phosphate guanylyltransferase